MWLLPVNNLPQRHRAGLTLIRQPSTNQNSGGGNKDMARKQILMISTAVLLGLAAPAALAKVPADQAARLGKDLTPLGGEVAGTGDVPAYTGGLQAPPPGIKFDPKTQHPPNPWPGDKPKFTITNANAGQYADKLTEGQMAMLKALPTYKMNIYES